MSKKSKKKKDKSKDKGKAKAEAKTEGAEGEEATFVFDNGDELTLKFKGNSIVVEGAVIKTGHSNDDYVASVSAFIDGQKVEDFLMPFDYITRKYEIFSKYCLESGEHTLKLVLNNPHRDFALNATNMVIYDNE